MTGICLYQPKFEANFGSIMRIAYNFDVDFVCCVGSRYKHIKTDTPKAERHIPTFFFKDFNQFKESVPQDCSLVCLEINQKSRLLEKFCHPKNAIYIFGGEDRTIPEDIVAQTIPLKIETNKCLNQAVCAGIVLFHRKLYLS